MFVIVQCLKNIESTAKDPASIGLREKIGLTMKTSGVAITLTSVTDIMAFIAGSFTILPGLYDFCLISAATVAAIYFFQARMGFPVVTRLALGLPFLPSRWPLNYAHTMTSHFHASFVSFEKARPCFRHLELECSFLYVYAYLL